MTTMIIGGEKYQMPVWLKARLLDVQVTEDIAVLKVESGTERGAWHYVRHDSHVALSCDCKATIKCAHKLAAERYLASVEVLGKAMTSDLTAHVEDELGSQHNEPDGELAQQPARAPLPRLNTSKYGLSNPNYRPHHVACECGADGWQGHYKREYEQYQAEQARKAEKPLVVIDYQKVNSWVIEHGAARCVRTADLDYACPGGYQLAGEDGVERLNAILGCAGESEQARKATEREMYRDMFPDDYGYYGDVA